ncbi:META domain-containing protein [Novosphingobium huizhouense]|uniref:META domain-containing protein n=1 Tax=Novosphingobium huizhouense TaxID=2866625 RepID=UPI001CD825BF|nr:META domain-containing protein [Novosphingobium huizhouense]
MAGVLALAACAGAGAAHAPLAGTQWQIVRVDGAASAAPDKARIAFDAARISANVGCNGMGGDYRVEGGRVIAGPLIATQMFCDGPVWDQEQAVSALLAGAPAFERSGRALRLKSAGHEVEARRLD